jgi:hypothetical protein
MTSVVLKYFIYVVLGLFANVAVAMVLLPLVHPWIHKGMNNGPKRSFGNSKGSRP